MKLPIDIPEVLNIATDMQEVRNTPLSLSLVIDSSAPSELSGHVRGAFSSEAASARVRINYIDDAGVYEAEREGDDIAVIVAGTNPNVGKLAQSCRDKGVPTMVVTNDGLEVSSIADASGYPIPPADIIMPVKLAPKFEVKLLKKANGEELHDNDAGVGAVALDAAAFEILDTRMGKWVISVCRHKDLAFAYSFVFIRRPLAMESINMTAMQNGAIGFVPFIPGADMPVMTLNQVKMTLQIATAYGQNIDRDRAKEIIAVVCGAFFCRHIVRSVAKAIPGIGWVASGVVGYVATEAMGRALLEYFEAGGDIVGAANVLQVARDEATSKSKEFAESDFGRALIQRISSSNLPNLLKRK